MGIINNFLIVELDLRYRWYALRGMILLRKGIEH